MKKWIMILLIIFLTLSAFTGCKIKSTDIPITRKKPNGFYYTNLLANSMIENNTLKGSIFEVNLHREKELPQEGYNTILDFFKALDSNNFTVKPADLPSKPQYKLFINTKNDKYIINVYNEKYVAIHPWDGVYMEDYIDMSDINARYNLYGLCKYFYK